ncbi:MAG: peroxiredoxin [Deltaproteobacteria bacterium]|nr:peroxiredoxin [Deltaproteobacteria bacterium]
MKRLFVVIALTACSWPAWALPAPGQPAPPFTTVDEQGNKVSLEQFRGMPVVLYAYPKDDTPGCTVEAKQFNAARDRLHALGAVVLGISGQDAQSHREFKAKYGLDFPLLVDPDRKVMKAYGFWNGLWASRKTVLIGPDGRVVRTWDDVKPQGHDEEVLAELEKLVPRKAK